MVATAERGSRRAQLRAIVRYLRTVREVVKRGAAEHSRWVHFIAEAASLLRRPPSPHLKPDRAKAHKYAVYFHQYGRFLAQQKPPAYCAPLHDSSNGTSVNVPLSVTVTPLQPPNHPW